MKKKHTTNTIITLLGVLLFLSRTLYSQDTSQYLHQASPHSIHLITVSLPISQSHFYTSDVSRIFDEDLNLYPNIAVQYDYISDKLLTATFVLTQENHAAVSKRFLDYNLHFITADLLAGFNLIRRGQNPANGGIIGRATLGPYFSYLFYGEEGGYEIDHAFLNKRPFGISFGVSLLAFLKQTDNKMLINLDFKIHHSLSKILDFKVDAYYLSFLTLKLCASI